ncbi:unnamed protein product [Ixodes pacificus]
MFFRMDDTKSSVSTDVDVLGGGRGGNSSAAPKGLASRGRVKTQMFRAAHLQDPLWSPMAWNYEASAVRTITFQRSPSGQHRSPSRLGFDLHVDEGQGFFVSHVDTASSAFLAGLRPGDRILAANHVSFRDVDLASALQLSLNVEKGGQLGLTIRGGLDYGLGVFVTAVDPESAADLAGLQVGDQILSVNEQELSVATHDDAAELLRQSPHMVLEVRRLGKLPCDASESPPRDYSNDPDGSDHGIPSDNSSPTHELHSSAESVNALPKHMSDGQVEALPGPSFHTDGSRDGSEGNISPSIRRHGSVGESASELETNAESRPQNVASESSTDADTISKVSAIITDLDHFDTQHNPFQGAQERSVHWPGLRGEPLTSGPVHANRAAESQRRRRRQRPAVGGRIRIDLVERGTESVSHAASGVYDEKASSSALSGERAFQGRCCSWKRLHALARTAARANARRGWPAESA